MDFYDILADIFILLAYFDININLWDQSGSKLKANSTYGLNTKTRAADNIVDASEDKLLQSTDDGFLEFVAVCGFLFASL